ncbi:hypothetical protein Ssi02_19170 [Sinosporangium siamense]|uniref:Uncharacterized protein n=1 Tax=Sinosporangium siamense TaxID=1367973 RepID=A0A919RD21_9ACTN|nr:hypothetical protein Ssi02_19170 [Sinosporangium siamense]
MRRRMDNRDPGHAPGFAVPGGRGASRPGVLRSTRAPRFAWAKGAMPSAGREKVVPPPPEGVCGGTVGCGGIAVGQGSGGSWPIVS